jgi:hypothetical protein
MNALADPGQLGFLNRTPYGDVVFAAQTAEEKAARTASIKELEYGLTMGLPMTPEGHIALPDAQGHVDPSAIQRPPMRFFKIFLNGSSAEQAARLAARLLDERKTDKMSPADIAGHPRHIQVESGYADSMAAASEPWAPAYAIPNDNKTTGWRKVAQIADLILEDMSPQRPTTQVARAEREAMARPLLAEVEKALRHK